jgi:hypothetical protein
MCYEDCIKMLGLFADGGQTRNSIALAEAGINENARPLGPDKH